MVDTTCNITNVLLNHLRVKVCSTATHLLLVVQQWPRVRSTRHVQRSKCLYDGDRWCKQTEFNMADTTCKVNSALLNLQDMTIRILLFSQ